MLRTSASVSGALGRVRVWWLFGVLLVAAGVLSGLLFVVPAHAAASDPDAQQGTGPVIDLRMPANGRGGSGSTVVKAREVVALRTAESNTYALADGARVARVF